MTVAHITGQGFWLDRVSSDGNAIGLTTVLYQGQFVFSCL